MMKECTSDSFPFKANCKCRMLYLIKDKIICDHDWEQCNSVKCLEDKKEYVIVDEEDCKRHLPDASEYDPVIAEIAKANEELEDTLHKINFYNLLEKRLKEYKGNPYQGRLTIGHYVGIKQNVDDNPYEYKEYVIGLIEDYLEDDYGNITIYVLSKPDNTDVTVPVEYTYRIY